MLDHATPRSSRGKRVKAAAGAMLALMVVLYAVSRSYEAHWPWLVWVRAFAEAGMVGGLADWFAVTALFRHPLGLPIPHTAVIPKEKDRIGSALASFVRGNFLTAERICNQVQALKLVEHLAAWLSRPDKAHQTAARLSSTLPILLDALEKHDVHQQISHKLIKQLRKLEPADLIQKLITWLLDGQRDRRVLAPVLAQVASTLDSNKERIESAAGDKAPLRQVPLLGRISRAIAEDFSERTTGNVATKLINASQDPTDPLWDWIETQLATARQKVTEDREIRVQLALIIGDWLEDPETAQLSDRLWQQIRTSIDQDLSRGESRTANNISRVIMAMGNAVQQDAAVASKIETVLIDALAKVLHKHGAHMETMIRETIEEWDANTMMRKLEDQVGPDLQFIRINGTLIGGLVGVILHAVGTLIW